MHYELQQQNKIGKSHQVYLTPSEDFVSLCVLSSKFLLIHWQKKKTYC
jgi:hypothetical protein